MEQEIKDFITPALNQRVWNVRRNVGSMLLFEVGREIEQNRGEYHFWINCSHWWLQRGEGSEFIDIVNSESSKKTIDEKLSILKNKKILHVQYNSEIYSTIFDFEDGLFLRVSLYGGGKSQDQWLVFSPQQVLKVDSSGRVLISSV